MEKGGPLRDRLSLTSSAAGPHPPPSPAVREREPSGTERFSLSTRQEPLPRGPRQKPPARSPAKAPPRGPRQEPPRAVSGKSPSPALRERGWGEGSGRAPTWPSDWTFLRDS